MENITRKLALLGVGGNRIGKVNLGVQALTFAIHLQSSLVHLKPLCMDLSWGPCPASQPVTKSKLTLLAAQQANKSERQGVEARNMTLFEKPADQEDGRLMSQSNHLVGLWMPGSFTEPERGAMRNKNQKAE